MLVDRMALIKDGTLPRFVSDDVHGGNTIHDGSKHIHQYLVRRKDISEGANDGISVLSVQMLDRHFGCLTRDNIHLGSSVWSREGTEAVRCSGVGD